MRYALPFVVLFAGTFVVIACSSDETPKDDKDAGGSIIPVGTSGGTTVTGGGDDDDDDGGKVACETTSKPYDCAKQTAHAKEANCAKFDEAKYKEDCESQNCGTPAKCVDATKALGDCVLEAPLSCDGDQISSDTPTECDDKSSALVACLTSK